MHMRRWSTEAMIELGESVLDSEHRFAKALHQLPDRNNMSSQMAGVQGRLVASQQPAEDALATLNAAFDAVRAIHRRWRQAVFLMLRSHTHLAAADEDDGRLKQYAELRDLLYPDGLWDFVYDYRDENGNIRIHDKPLTPEMWKLLESFSLGNWHLGDAVMFFIRAGEESDRLEELRKQLEQTGETEPHDEVREQWFEVFGAVRDALAPSRENADVDALLSRMEELDRTFAESSDAG